MTHIKMPKGVLANLDWRMRLNQSCMSDAGLRSEVIQKCREDPQFFVSAFCYSYNPHYEQKEWPFIPFQCQEEAILELDKCIEIGKDACMLKSREVGASWLCLYVFTRRWLFKRMERFFIISRKTDLVDMPGNPDSLFWKVDFCLSKLPRWMLPRFERRKLQLENLDTGATITGDSTTEGSGVGGRCTAMLLDEFSRMENLSGILIGTQTVARSRIFNFTVYGQNDTLTKLTQNPHVSQIRLPWYRHPHKNPGMYKYDLEDRKLKFYEWSDDKRDLNQCGRHSYKPDYDFVLDGKLRSISYDKAWWDCSGNSRAMAMNWDMDMQGANYQAFDMTMLNEYIRKFCAPPRFEGDIECDRVTGHPRCFVPGDNGPVKMWCNLDGRGKPPKGKYVAGIDVSQGMGVSNSCMSIADSLTGTKVLEFATSSLQPGAFASSCVAIARMFWDCFLCWEIPGPGLNFGKTVVDELGYPHYYLHVYEHELKRKVSDKPGYHMSREGKTNLITNYRERLSRKLFSNPSEEAIVECKDFIVMSDGNIEHSEAEMKDNPFGAKKTHGDRVIADALCDKMCSNASARMPDKKEQVLFGTIAWRWQQADKMMAAADDW